jgi:hypothetical protein
MGGTGRKVSSPEFAVKASAALQGLGTRRGFVRDLSIRGSEYDLLIAQTYQRGELVAKSPGSGRVLVKDAYFWTVPC